jgi:DegV family protein with EDD domain
VTVALVTDSNAQLPAELVERYGVTVVPLTVTVDGTPHLEGTELDADAFYARFEGGATPTVATSQPSPGQFAEVYESLAASGATDILSIHIGSDVSGTCNSARLAAGSSSVPVRLVDTGTASFGVACCVWEAAEVLASGGSLDEAATVAAELGPTIGNVFTVRALDLARAGGRLAAGSDAEPAAIPILSLVAGEMKVVGQATDVDGAADAMADYALAAGGSLRIGLGVADAAAAPLWQALEARLQGSPQVREVVRYRIGPSVGAHTGPGTAGAFFYTALGGTSTSA